MRAKRSEAPRGQSCGLRGKTTRLTRTECCGRSICDDESEYRMFSYARNSCARNHRRFTLCGFHHTEGHRGAWQECRSCRTFETEMYVWYGTNEYNFEKLPDPPAYEPTLCSSCGVVIVLSRDEYSQLGARYTCGGCQDREMSVPGPSRPARRKTSGRTAPNRPGPHKGRR